MLAFVLAIGVACNVSASDFWDEVRTPGLRAYTRLVADARRSFNSGQHTVALGMTDEAVALLANQSEAYVVRGRAYAALNRAPDAKTAFERALELRAEALDDSQDANVAARIAAEVGDYAMATRILSRAVDREAPGGVRSVLYVMLADMHQCQGADHLRDAVSAYRSGLRTAASDLRSRAGLSLALRRLGERADATAAVGSVLSTGGRLGNALSAARSVLPAVEIAAREAVLLEAMHDEAGARAAWTRAAAEGTWQAFAAEELRTLSARMATPAANARTPRPVAARTPPRP